MRQRQRGSVFRKVLFGLLGLALVLAVAIGVLGQVYGVWGALFPSSSHETVPPDVPKLDSPAILLFTKTNGFRHVEGIEAGSALIKKIAERRGWDIFHTENGAVFNDQQLAGFAAVIFHNASGDTLNEEQELSFQRWLENGGGWLGTHAAGDGSHAQWAWYAENLIGVKFTAHIMGPQFQTATVQVEDHSNPATAKLPPTWEHKEEWYSWESSPRPLGFTILATVDEETYTPVQDFMGSQNDLRMGDHPIVWSRCINQGRSIYSTMGHAADAYENPPHQQLLEGAMAWVVGEEGQACPRGD